jgi:D-psicose/D-tagatose/L-ribulose 3-epimerase
VRAAAVDHLDRVLDCGAAFGCEILCGPDPLGHRRLLGAGADRGRVPRRRRHPAPGRRAGAGPRHPPGVEYLNRFEIYFLTTAADAARFVREVNHPHLRMMYDSFHAHIEEKDQARAIASCAAETIHVHVSENDRGTPGTGQVDWDGFFLG